MFLRKAAVSTGGTGLSGVGWVIMMPGVTSGFWGVMQAVISMSVLSSLVILDTVADAPTERLCAVWNIEILGH